MKVNKWIITCSIAVCIVSLFIFEEFTDGKFYDEILYGLTKDEFSELVKQYHATCKMLQCKRITGNYPLTSAVNSNLTVL